jgi:uncharacterized surface protein with fasciclin (FAS1) repeats
MKTFSSTLAITALLSLAACSAPETDTAATDEVAASDPMAEPAAAGTIVELAQGNGDLSTLVSAVQAAELGQTLSGPGPYTVFAPTNAAFAKVPEAARTQLMSPAGKADLTSILTYHVVEGETMSPALIAAIEGAGDKGYAIKTVNGATLTAMLDGGSVVLTDAAGNRATVVQADVDAANGVVHVIDGVLMPK